MTFLLFAASLICGLSCKRREVIKPEPTDESGATLQSQVQMNDSQSSIQLLKGFYEMEQNAWRWTASKFVLSLKTPAGAAERGGTLAMRFTAPEPVIKKGPTTVVASVNGTSVGSETYTTPGEYTFRKDVPASALKGDAVTVEFTVDKFLAAGEADLRELALIVSSIGLETK